MVLFSFPLIARQVYPKGIDKAITNTTKKPETNEAYVTMAEKSKIPELPDSAGSSGGMADSDFTPSINSGFCIFGA